MTEDEAATVAALAEQCVWDGPRRLGAIMRYGRLFTAGSDAGGGVYPMLPAMAGKNAYQRAVDTGLLYAEGYARHGRVETHSAWCLDGETVVDPGFSQPGTAYFGVALRMNYVRQVHEARRRDDGSDGFMYVFKSSGSRNDPPLDPDADTVLGLGRDIPPSVRNWALTAKPPAARGREVPAWLMEQLLRFGDRRPPNPYPYR